MNSNKMSSGVGGIPNRWLHCPRKSQVIAERFLAFKTPLSIDYTKQMPLECVFLPSMIFDYCKSVKLNLGLWIDLTNTKRFYDAEQIRQRNVQYVKMQCRGHGETPTTEQTRAFIEIVDEFINERPFDTIGVHCTHGFNRTGFLIVSYLVERLDCAVEAALAMFAQARPPGIYKQDYINELFRRYDNINDAIEAPELPDWCLDYADADMPSSQKRQFDAAFAATTSQQAQYICGENDEEQPQDEDDGDDANSAENGGNDENKLQPRKKRKRENLIKNATFMEGVPGVEQVTDQPRLGELQRKVQEMCGWNSTGFPGSQPVSMDRKNINLLKEMPYMVSWKADGNRYMMLINARDEIYFFDRNHSCFQVENLTFVMANDLRQHLTDTLLDGEMVLDKYQGKVTPRYLIYDIIRISNKPIGQEHFPIRFRCIRKEIIDARQQAMQHGLINRQMEPFGVRVKDFYDIRHAAALLSDRFAKQLLHEPDGLIFQPKDEPYVAGTCAKVLKWKPHELNSVDFRLKIVTESGMGILTRKIGLLYVLGSDLPFGKMRINRQNKDLQNKIVEATLNRRMEWDFLRERTDKSHPNSFKTANAVLESIRAPVTKQGLLDFIAQHGYKDDRERMPPPATHLVQRVAQQQQQLQLQQQQQYQQQLQQQQQQQERMAVAARLQHEQQQLHELQQQQFAIGNEEDDLSDNDLDENKPKLTRQKSDSQSESSDYEEEPHQQQQQQQQQHYQRSELSDSDSS